MSPDLVTANEFSRSSPGFDVGEIRLSRDRTYEIFDAWQPRKFSPRTDSRIHSFTRDRELGETPRRRARACSEIARFRFYHVGGNTYHGYRVDFTKPSVPHCLPSDRSECRLLYACSLVDQPKSRSSRSPIVSYNVALPIDLSVSFRESWLFLVKDEIPWSTPVFINVPVGHLPSFHFTSHTNNEYFIAASNYFKITSDTTLSAFFHFVFSQ